MFVAVLFVKDKKYRINLIFFTIRISSENYVENEYVDQNDLKKRKCGMETQRSFSAMKIEQNFDIIRKMAGTGNNYAK